MRTFRLSDVLTVPNAISALGLVLVLHGSARADTARGIAETVAGRLLDLLDGEVARKLDQSSEFGAGVDATFDKAGVLAIGINEWRGGIAPKPALLAIAAQNAVNLVATAVATRLGGDKDLAPVDEGKYAMAYQNGALGAYAVSALLRRRGNGRASMVFRIIGDADTLIGTGYFGIRASRRYVTRVVELTRSRNLRRSGGANSA
ncbi:phosphatidylglycerophosphate synthase [Nakamurella sp. UYEF19]|uniref:CDP-alcohol phosphatidyltransferase family protein n=1 Tax=Nakamurella sp. UYEF19 TaxID=1756392 RepID=UPI003396E45C